MTQMLKLSIFMSFVLCGPVKASSSTGAIVLSWERGYLNLLRETKRTLNTHGKTEENTDVDSELGHTTALILIMGRL